MWNWNVYKWTWHTESDALLIEPCGIEIQKEIGIGYCWRPFNRTMWNWNMDEAKILFFVQESFNRTMWNWNLENPFMKIHQRLLLIEPCGIEIVDVGGAVWLFIPFNRTMWNWNKNKNLVAWIGGGLLIEPCGIEIMDLSDLAMATRLLIEPCGIEIDQRR